MEDGFVHAVQGAFWDTKEHKFTRWRSHDLQTLISDWGWTLPRVKAQRSEKCKLVILKYNNEVK